MSVDERLFALAMQYRDRRGPAALGDAATLIADLTAQAPDLQNEVRALAAATGMNAAGRIAAAGNAELEVQAIAADIAATHRLPRASAGAGVAVARRLGPVLVMAYAPPAVPLPPQIAKKSLWQSPWVIGTIGAVALVFGYRQMNAKPAPLPLPPITITVGEGSDSGPSDPERDKQPSAAVDPPELAPPDGPLPTLIEMPPTAQTKGLVTVFGFKYNFDRKQIVVVAVPVDGWDAKSGGALYFFDNGRNLTSLADVSFESGSSDQKPARVIQAKWKRDDAGVGPMCLAFIGNQSGPDVVLRGSKLCLLSSSCDQTISCGRIP
jgi:hypothetical protein